MSRLLRRGVLLVVLAACGTVAEGVETPLTSALLDTLPIATPAGDNAAATAPAPTTTTTTTTTNPPKEPITLGFAGDTSFTHGLDGRDPLGEVVALLAAPDLTAVNLETTMGEPGVGSPLAKTYIFRSPPHTVEMLSAAGVDVVSLANNHTLDYGREGLLRTTQLLDDGGIGHFGAGPDTAAAYAPYVTRVGDWDVGFVGFTHIECGWVADDPTRWPESAWACPGFEPQTVASVSAAAGRADFVVVMVHWGIEKDHCPQDYQRQLAQQWIAAGADLIIGSHPHVLQGIERIDGVWVVHSTGNFAFPSARDVSARSAYFEVTVSEQAVDLAVVPLRIIDGRPHPVDGDDAASILGDLGNWSFGWTVTPQGGVAPRRGGGACD